MLKNKVAFVTGGSGALGGAIVRVMAREGCSVAYSYNSSNEKAGELDKEMASAGRNVKSYQLDVLDGKSACTLAETIEKDLGPVDILVNNAGLTQVMPFAMINEDDWDIIMDVNVKGMFLVTKAFARGMIRRKRGVIIKSLILFIKEGYNKLIFSIAFLRTGFLRIFIKKWVKILYHAFVYD